MLVSFQNTLYVVAMPIGNPMDLSLRARELLSQADIILCEDTRQTIKAIQLLGIAFSGRLVSCHEHNEAIMAKKAIDWIHNDKKVCLVSDAGTPLICDPGAILVNLLRESGIKISPAPGPSSVTSFLSVLGAPAIPVVFIGFMSRKESAIRDFFLDFQLKRDVLLVFLESPHRLRQTLELGLSILGADNKCYLGRELTKTYEQVTSMTLGETIKALDESIPILGEFIVALELKKIKVSDELWHKAVANLLDVLSTKDIIKVIQKVFDIKKNAIYDYINELKSQNTTD